MTDQEIVDRMFDQPEFKNGLLDQIGGLKSHEIDRINKKIHFYGNKMNCTFELGAVLSSFENLDKQIDQYKQVTFE